MRSPSAARIRAAFARIACGDTGSCFGYALAFGCAHTPSLPRYALAFGCAYTRGFCPIACGDTGSCFGYALAFGCAHTRGFFSSATPFRKWRLRTKVN